MARRRDSTSDYSGEVSQLLPDARDDGLLSDLGRFGKSNEQYQLIISPDMADAAAEGSYFVLATQTPPGAALNTAYTATSAFLVIENLANPANPAAPSMILDYIWLLDATTNATILNVSFAVVLDIVSARSVIGDFDFTNRISCTNGLVGVRSVARVFCGLNAVGAATSTQRMVVGQRTLSQHSGGSVFGDVHTMKFGSVDQTSFISGNVFSLNSLPPVAVPAGWLMLLHLWFPGGSSSKSYVPEIGWRER